MIAVHDCDIVSYSRELLARLCYPTANPNLGYAADFPTSFMSSERGTIVVDLWEATANELIWRGEVIKVLSPNPDTNLTRIDKGIARMFESFPPGS